MAVSLKHTTLTTESPTGPGGTITAAEWDEAHDLQMAADRLLGRTTAGAGAVEEISIGSGLSMAAGVLSASGGSVSSPFVGGYLGGGVVSGRIVLSNGNSGSGGNTTYNANDFQLVPFVPSVTFTLSSIGVRAGSTAAGNAKIAIYSSGTNGWPSTLLFESASFSVATAFTDFFTTCTQTLTVGQVYWLGIRVSASTQLWGDSGSTVRPVGMTGTALNNAASRALNHTLTFATAAPTTFPTVTTSMFQFVNAIIFGLTPA